MALREVRIISREHITKQRKRSGSGKISNINKYENERRIYLENQVNLDLEYDIWKTSKTLSSCDITESKKEAMSLSSEEEAGFR